MPELSSYPPVTTLAGTERIPVVTTPGVAGGNAYITAADLTTDLATDTAFASRYAPFPTAAQKIVHVSPAGLDTNNGLSAGTALKTFAAALTAIGAGNQGHIELGVGTIDMGAGQSLSGHRVTFSGQGEGTVLTPSVAQVGPVLNFVGYLSPNNAGQRRTIGHFRVQGDGTAGATKKGINFDHLAGMTVTDITVDSTGGACFDYGTSTLSDFVRLIANQPVSANANDVAYHQANDAGNGNRFTGCGCRSITSDPEGVSGAVRFLDGPSYAIEYNQHNGWWFEFLHVPTNGCLIWQRGGNVNSWNDTQIFDCSPVGGATGTSFVKFDTGTFGANGGNTWRGVIPGSDGGWATGIAMNQPRNSVIGPKGYNGTNITLGVNVEYTNVILTGRVSGAGATVGFVDNSTKTTNLILDLTNGALTIALGSFDAAIGGQGLGVTKISTAYFAPPAAVISVATPGVSTLCLVPLVVSEAITLDRIGIEITTGVATATPRLGIFTKVGDVITRVLDAGTVDGSTTGFKEITISQVLKPGTYWLGMANQVAAAGVRTGNLNVAGYCNTVALTLSQNLLSCLYVTAVAGAFPATLSALNATLNGPRVLVRVV